MSGERAGEGLGWGIVGFGWVARDFMAPAIAAAGHRLVAVSDPDPTSRAAAAALGARAHPDLAGLLADPAVEAVYVATPNHLHRAAVEGIAAAGRPVLCEKPMAAGLGDAAAIADAVERTGILYRTAFDQRHHPAHRRLREAIRAGRIGTVTGVRIVYACWLGREWDPTGTSGGTGPGDNWRIDPARAGGGALIDLAPHGLDLVDFLLDEPLAAVAGLTQSRVQDYAVDDGAMLVGRTASGVLASLHVAYNYPEALPRRRLEVAGARGLLVATDTMGQDAGGRLVRVDGADGREEVISFDAAASPFAEQVLAFGRSVREGARDPGAARRDLHTMHLLARAYGGTGDAPSVPSEAGAAEAALSLAS